MTEQKYPDSSPSSLTKEGQKNHKVHSCVLKLLIIKEHWKLIIEETIFDSDFWGNLYP